MQSKKEDTVFEILCKMLDGNIDVSEAIPDSKIWFALHHPKVNYMAFHKNYLLGSYQDMCKSPYACVM